MKIPSDIGRFVPVLKHHTMKMYGGVEI